MSGCAGVAEKPIEKTPAGSPLPGNSWGDEVVMVMPLPQSSSPPGRLQIKAPPAGIRDGRYVPLWVVAICVGAKATSIRYSSPGMIRDPHDHR